jgi:hypothetical protein
MDGRDHAITHQRDEQQIKTAGRQRRQAAFHCVGLHSGFALVGLKNF